MPTVLRLAILLLLVGCGSPGSRTWTVINNSTKTLHASLEMAADYNNQKESFDVAPGTTQTYHWSFTGPNCPCGGGDDESSESWIISADPNVAMGSGEGPNAIPSSITCDDAGCPAGGPGAPPLTPPVTTDPTPTELTVTSMGGAALIGDCAVLTIGAHATGNSLPLTADLTVDVQASNAEASPAPVAVYADAQCMTQVTSIVIKAGADTAFLYIKRPPGTTSGKNAEISANASGLTGGLEIFSWN